MIEIQRQKRNAIAGETLHWANSKNVSCPYCKTPPQGHLSLTHSYLSVDVRVALLTADGDDRDRWLLEVPELLRRVDPNAPGIMFLNSAR